MTKCSECDVVDLGITQIIKDDEVFLLCPNCGAEDSVEEIDELEWIENIALDEADSKNDLEGDLE